MQAIRNIPIGRRLGLAFAVVASEVRHLAGRSAEAANSLKQQAEQLVQAVAVFKLARH
jgi:methyl-accepting chemotaxis protein